MRSSRRVAVLGSTGSIGTNTLDVIRNLPGRFDVVALSARSNWKLLAEQCVEFQPEFAVIEDTVSFQAADRSAFPTETQILQGQDGILRVAGGGDAEIIVSAIVGAAGLAGTLAALEAGRIVALANKESLVVAGPLVMELARKRGGSIRPIDSEHSAVLQALTGHSIEEIERIVLTGSGGPFRGKRARELESATPEEALKHPTWRMGPKISIDSATLMNKALEVIEARWLFGLSSERINVIIHPESIIHSFVEFVDGSVLAQLSPPDMRLPIQYALLYPERIAGVAKRLDWATLAALKFEQPDRETFESLNLGFEVAERGGSCGAILNAANEAAVENFLSGQLGFLDIARCCRSILDAHDFESAPTFERLLALDHWARQEVVRWTKMRIPAR